MAPTRPHRPFLRGFHRGTGRQRNQVERDKVRAETPTRRKVRHDICFALLGAAFGSPDCCFRKLQEKLDRAERLMTPPNSSASSLEPLLLRFCLDWCQTSYHARTMPLDCLLFCAQKVQTSRKNCLGGVIPVAMTMRLGSLLRPPSKKRGFGTRDPVLHSTAAFLASSSSATSFCNSLWTGYNDTRPPRTTRPGGRMARHALRVNLSNLCDAHTGQLDETLYWDASWYCIECCAGCSEKEDVEYLGCG